MQIHAVAKRRHADAVAAALKPDRMGRLVYITDEVDEEFEGIDASAIFVQVGDGAIDGGKEAIALGRERRDSRKTAANSRNAALSKAKPPQLGVSSSVASDAWPRGHRCSSILAFQL